MLPIPIILWGSFVQSRIAPRYANVRERASLINEIMNNLSGIETVKSFTAEEREVQTHARVERGIQKPTLMPFDCLRRFLR